MTMAHGEHELRMTGDPQDAAIADLLAAALRLRGGRDIPLPDTETPAPCDALEIITGSAGALAITSVNPEAPVTGSQVELEANRTAIMMQRLQEKAFPYIRAISSDLELTDPQRSLWNRLGRDGRRKTSERRSFGQYELQYDAGTRFKFDDEMVRPYAYRLDISHMQQNRPHYRAGLDLEFTNEDLKILKLRWLGDGIVLGDLILKDSPLRELMSLYGSDDSPEAAHVMTIDLSGPAPNMRFVHNEYCLKNTNDYVYDPKRDLFPQKFIKGRAMARETEFSPDEFLRLATDSLSLIPTQKLVV